jgi:hypothetical protein
MDDGDEKLTLELRLVVSTAAIQAAIESSIADVPR